MVVISKKRKSSKQKVMKKKPMKGGKSCMKKKPIKKKPMKGGKSCMKKKSMKNKKVMRGGCGPMRSGCNLMKGGKPKKMQMSKTVKKPDFVLYYADYCGWCKLLKDRLKKIKINSKIKLVDVVDPKNEKEVMNNNIMTIPTMKNAKNNKILNIPPSNVDLARLLTV